MAPDPRVGTRFGPYRIDALLGRGGMGAVYDAFDTVKGRRVALKLLHTELARSPDFAERFRRESHTAAQIAEPHVIPIHDWGEIDGTLYIDMRYVDGRDLRSLLRGGPLTPDRAVAITGQVGAALDAAHRAGLVHRDIKPDNILITGDDFAYLADFGIAQAVTDTRLTAAGSAIGSHAYMAPERFDGHTGDAAADVYALTCVLHEALTGRSPFPATTAAGVMRAHLMDPPPRPSLTPGIPASFDAVIATGMAKDPARRYRSAGELARAAAAALAGGAAGGDRRREPPTQGRPLATLYGTDSTPGSTRYDSGPTPASTRYDSGPTPGLAGPASTRSGTGWPPGTGRPPGTGGPMPVYAAPQAPPPQRRSAVPALLATVVVVLLVLVAVLVWYLMSKEQDTTSPQTGSSTRTVTGSSSGSTSVPSTTSTSTTPPLLGTVSGTDDHGFVSSLARCDGNDLAQFILRTTAPAGKDESLVVICRSGATGDLYYHGARGTGDLLVTDVVQSGSSYIATNGSHRYTVSPTGLRITENGSLLADEPVAEYAYRR